MEPAQIRNLRLALGMTQAQFGDLFGKKWRAVAYWESGNRKPPKADRHAMVILARVKGKIT